MKHIILPGLTTTPKSDWKSKIEEINKLKLKEIALFTTFLEISKRKELYSLLEKTKLERIPHIHLRDDFEEWELDYFCKKYKTEVSNIHPDERAMSFLSKVKKPFPVYLENQEGCGEEFEKMVQKCAGICLDVSHAEDTLLIEGEKEAEKIFKFIKKYSVGCSHVSVVKSFSHKEKHCITKQKISFFSDHWIDDFPELDYVRKYVEYLPKYVSIELENPFSRQLEVKKYLEKIINR